MNLLHVTKYNLFHVKHSLLLYVAVCFILCYYQFVVLFNLYLFLVRWFCNMKMTVYYDGDAAELKSMLEHGIKVCDVKLLKTGYSVLFTDRRCYRVGRPPRYTKEQLDNMYTLYLSGSSFSDIASEMGCSRQYVSRVVNSRIKNNRKKRLSAPCCR